MTLRALAIGLLLGLAIAAGTYFNDWVVRQTPLVGNLFPVSVFGGIAGLLLLAGPLLGALRRQWAFTARELAVIAALGLAVCGWAGSGFARYFGSLMVMPSQWARIRTNWQAHEVLSYLPGGSARLGEGHVRDWVGFCRRLNDPQDSSAVVRRLAEALPAEPRRVVAGAASEGRIDGNQARVVLRAVNAALEGRSLLDAQPRPQPLPPQVARLLEDPAALEADALLRVNRWLLVAALPEHILPPPAPEDGGLLVRGGRADPDVTESMAQGWGARPPLDPARLPAWARTGIGALDGLRDATARVPGLRLVTAWLRDAAVNVAAVPWGAWWPSIRLWGGLALCLAAASLCVVLIVHPQWTRHELLPYPLAQFVQELAERQAGRLLPDVARSRLFWGGLAAVVVLHALNAGRAWYPDFPIHVPLKFDFTGLRTLFPNAARVEGQADLFSPTIYPSVMAFAFFLATDVSLALGLALVLWVAFGTVMLGYGVTWQDRWAEGSANTLLLFGASLGMALTVLYTGRRYYADVLRGALGSRRTPATPRSAVWAARGLGLALALAVWILMGAGLDWILAVPTVLLVMLSYLVITRLNAETGLFLIQPRWLPAAVLTALAGFEAVGPTGWVVMALASTVLLMDPRETLMAQTANALRIADVTGRLRPSRAVWPVAAMVALGLAAALVGTLTVQYHFGVSLTDSHARSGAAGYPFDRLALHLPALAADGRLESAMRLTGLQRLAAIDPMPHTLVWVGLGLVLFLSFAWARLRLPWWPVHPAIFLLWGSFAAVCYSISFLVGWALKTAVVRLAGARGYARLKPLMVGIIAGELLVALVLLVLGLVYYFSTGKQPPTYHVFRV